MRRKPSASHWVKNESLLTYRPMSLVFLAGAQVVKISRSKGSWPSGRFSSTSWPAFHLEAGALAVDQHARQVQLLAVQAQRLGGHIRISAQAHLVEHAGLGRVQVKGSSTVSIQKAGAW
jgi:hypothetical protein